MTDVLIVVISLVLLVKAADIFVDQASSLAKKWGVGDFTIGFTVVAFGTSLPELISTIFSAGAGHNQLVMSNIIGSNLSNLCLVFGGIAVLRGYVIRKRDVDINIPLNFVALTAFWAFAVWSNFIITWSYGVSLILIFLTLILLSKSYNHADTINLDYPKYRPVMLLGSLLVMILSGKLCIDQIIAMAQHLNIAETLLGYFLLAVGTSLPELVTTWVSVKKNEGEMGIGNILGSNLFNLLFVIGLSSMISPVIVNGFKTDLIFLSGATLAVYAFAILGKKYSFSRNEGWGMLAIYAVFILIQVF